VHRYPLEISIVDVFVKHTSFPFNKLPKIYSFLASNPKMWEALYFTTKAAAGTEIDPREGLALTWIDHFTRCILEEDPDVIISVHPLVSLFFISLPPPSPSLPLTCARSSYLHTEKQRKRRAYACARTHAPTHTHMQDACARKHVHIRSLLTLE